MSGGCDRGESTDRSALRDDRGRLEADRKGLVRDLATIRATAEAKLSANRARLVAAQLDLRAWGETSSKINEVLQGFPSRPSPHDVADNEGSVARRHVEQCRQEIEEIFFDLEDRYYALELEIDQDSRDFANASARQELAIRQIDERLAELNQGLNKWGRTGAFAAEDGPVGLPHGAPTTRQRVLQVLRDASAPMQMKDVVRRVRESGCESTDATIRAQLAKLRNDRKVVLVSRGRYALPEGTDAATA
jgi:hypothetical protein